MLVVTRALVILHPAPHEGFVMWWAKRSTVVFWNRGARTGRVARARAFRAPRLDPARARAQRRPRHDPPALDLAVRVVARDAHVRGRHRGDDRAPADHGAHPGC